MGEVRGQEMSAGTPQAAALNIGQGVSGAGSRDPMSPLSPTPSLRYGDPRNCHSSPTSDPGPGLLCELKGFCQLPAAGLNLTFAVTSPGLPSRPTQGGSNGYQATGCLSNQATESEEMAFGVSSGVFPQPRDGEALGWPGVQA